MTVSMSMRRDPFAPGLLQRIEPTRTVVVLRASRMGDFLCTVPALRALRAALPEAEITLLTLPLLRDLALRLPYVDRYAAFPGWPGIAEQLFDARAAVRFLAEMQAEAFDLAIQMQGSGVNSNPFTLLLGARATAGFIRAGDGAGRLDAALAWPERGHEIERMLALTTFLGASPSPRDPQQGESASADFSPSAPCAGSSVPRSAPEPCAGPLVPRVATSLGTSNPRRTAFPLWPEDRTEADVLLGQAEPPLIGIHAGARDATRRWPAERFAAVGRELRAYHGGTLVLLGDAGERPLAAHMAELAGGAALNLAGRTSLPALGAIIARFALLVTNDTGPAHIAYALGTPSVTIFGGASPEAYGPPATGPHRVVSYSVPCRPRNGSTCPSCAHDLICLQRVTVGDVIAAAEALLAHTTISAQTMPTLSVGHDCITPTREESLDDARIP